jgi:hypothetical protein
MGFSDINLDSKYLTILDGETKILAFAGEPEYITNNFGEKKLTCTVYQFANDEWRCTTWGISSSTAKILFAEYLRAGRAWPSHAWEVSRRGQLKQTTYSMRPSSVQAPAGLVALTKAEMESGTWQREPIPAVAVAAAPTSPRILRAKYRMELSKADDQPRNYAVDQYGNADDCPDDKLAEAIDSLSIPW